MESPTDSGSLAEEEVRKANIAKLRALGVDPYPPAAFHPSLRIEEALLAADEHMRLETKMRLAGRVIAYRRLGRACFLDLLEDDQRLQLFLSPRDTAAGSWDILGMVDLGDFVGVEGVLFTTRSGELTLRTSELVILGKGLRFPPIGKRTADGSVHEALADPGRRLRDRHVALLADRRFRQGIIVRDRIIRAVREYFQQGGFVEVETPVLSSAYGGAAAKPFITRSQALDTDMYLRVSPECYLKRVLCGGIPKLFEIGKNFRNEGIDHSHNPEFTAIEWYEANTDYYDQMKRFQALVEQVTLRVHNTTIVQFRGRALDLAAPWPHLRVSDAVAAALGVGPGEMTVDLLSERWRNLAFEGTPPATWGEMIMALFEKLVEPTLWGPVFVIDHPLEVSPLTKRHRGDPRLVERFEPIVGGMELGNAYSELNDPVEQRVRLADQESGRDERYGLDELFLRAIEDGMPQAGGAGLGIDRLVMILTDAERLSDVLLFPAG